MINLQKHKILYLEAMLQEGYSLHGSPIGKLELLEPRQAQCNSKAPENNLRAVYASRNSVEVAAFMAVVSGKGNSGYHRDPDDPALLVHSNRQWGAGTIYILPSNTFQVVGNEWVSFESVTPLKKLRVTPSIIRYLVARGTVKLDSSTYIPEPW